MKTLYEDYGPYLYPRKASTKNEHKKTANKIGDFVGSLTQILNNLRLARELLNFYAVLFR
ncbi:hypothetical protein AST07_07600 [Staphylococcus saprophyticus]|nr:hypothetical protein CEQ14_12535 [Staphylococcus saprophyticus]OFK26112.1 hypothetical protein HMPREF2825_06070 [Staphylococcus sp. HMSC068H12]OOC95732.1 hypothetical protein BWO95_11150 [Staphylococcus saprophyticus subsp. saprophyticus ATCC 15305 = NCTC 7292]CRV24624.1 Uncharacterised protein [Streptococcus equi subsp. equi]ASF18698.1 hypothetical protein CEQ33_05485 [Staphylococcus saprophyticus]